MEKTRTENSVAEEQLLSYNPRILIVGYNEAGEFSSTVCCGKEDVSVALQRYVDFKFYWLKGSQRGCDYWQNKAAVFLKQKENDVSRTT